LKRSTRFKERERQKRTITIPPRQHQRLTGKKGEYVETTKEKKGSVGQGREVQEENGGRGFPSNEKSAGPSEPG